MNDNLPETIGVVDELYAAAIDTERYEDLLQTWSKAIGKSEQGAKKLESILSGHLDRAGELLEINNENSTIESVNTEHGVIVLNDSDEVIFANASAENSFAQQDISTIADFNLRETSQDRLNAAIELARSGQPQLVVLAALDRKNFLADISERVSAEDKREVHIETKQLVNSSLVNKLLKDAFALTPAEVDILELVLQGQTPSEIGKIRNRKLPTVRSQLKSLLSKTSTSSILELIRMAAGLTAWVSIPDEALDMNLRSSQERDSQFASRYKLPARRGGSINFSVLGPDDGKPLLYFHDEFFGDAITSDFETALFDKNIRLLCVFRPGYGETSMIKSSREAQDAIAQDVQAVLAHTGVPSPLYVVAHGVGMFRAVMFARENQHLVRSIVGVRPALPWEFENDLVNEPRFVRFAVLLSKSAPRSFEFVTRAGYRFYLRYGAEKFVERYFISAECDKRALKTTADIKSVIEESGAHVMKNGPSGLAKELVASKQSWRHGFDALSCPITLVIGEDDPTSRLQRAQQLAIDNPNTTIKTVEGAGHLVFYSHAHEVIASILETIPE